jgi:hypothetical protein
MDNLLNYLRHAFLDDQFVVAHHCDNCIRRFLNILNEVGVHGYLGIIDFSQYYHIYRTKASLGYIVILGRIP